MKPGEMILIFGMFFMIAGLGTLVYWFVAEDKHVISGIEKHDKGTVYYTTMAIGLILPIIGFIMTVYGLYKMHKHSTNIDMNNGAAWGQVFQDPSKA